MKTLLETMFGAIIATMVMMLSANMTDSVVSAGINGASDMKLDQAQRTLTDELQLHLRNSSKVLASATINGTTYTTDSDTIVLAAPAYNPSNSTYFLHGQDDTIVFNYDAANKQLRETIVASTGSVRSVRTNFTVARNVDRFAVLYNCREQFTASSTSANLTFTLKTAPASGSLTVYSNGLRQNVTVVGNVVTVVDTLTAGATLQMFYQPDVFSASAPVISVYFTANESFPGARSVRSIVAQGSARLRNCRN